MDAKPGMIESFKSGSDLWWIAVAPTIWATHFLACYTTTAIWCAKYATSSEDIGGLWWMISIYTIGAVSGIVAVGIRSYVNHRRGRSPLPHDDDTPEDRARFTAFAALLLSLLSLTATLFTALVFVLVRSCQ